MKTLKRRRHYDDELVRGRVARVLSDHPTLWQYGCIVKRGTTIGLPEATWVFLNRYAEMTGQTVDEVVAFLAQEHLGLIINALRRGMN